VPEEGTRGPQALRYGVFGLQCLAGSSTAPSSLTTPQAQRQGKSDISNGESGDLSNGFVDSSRSATWRFEATSSSWPSQIAAEDLCRCAVAQAFSRRAVEDPADVAQILISNADETYFARQVAAQPSIRVFN
jgi:hypothetical protein